MHNNAGNDCIDSCRQEVAAIKTDFLPKEHWPDLVVGGEHIPKQVAANPLFFLKMGAADSELARNMRKHLGVQETIKVLKIAVESANLICHEFCDQLIPLG